ncbi:MAG: hypothetical protein N2C14_00490, partial [Planctomycetales bacterium]
ICAGSHLVGMFTLAFLIAGGSELIPATADRARYVADFLPRWRLGWATWMFAAPTLIGFYSWWAARIPQSGPALAGVVVAAVGMCFDWLGESVYVAWLPDFALQQTNDAESLAKFAQVQQFATMLTAGVANGLYTLGGIILTLASPWLQGRLRATAWIIWTAGIGMSVSAVLESPHGAAVCSAILFPLLTMWCFWMGRAKPCVE